MPKEIIREFSFSAFVDVTNGDIALLCDPMWWLPEFSNFHPQDFIDGYDFVDSRRPLELEDGVWSVTAGGQLVLQVDDLQRVTDLKVKTEKSGWTLAVLINPTVEVPKPLRPGHGFKVSFGND